jgi:hypothetical protein
LNLPLLRSIAIREITPPTLEPESVIMNPERAKMPGSIVGYEVSPPLHQVNFAGLFISPNKPKTEAFRASEGLNASLIQVI